jgi:hypothetical protein
MLTSCQMPKHGGICHEINIVVSLFQGTLNLDWPTIREVNIIINLISMADHYKAWGFQS